MKEQDAELPVQPIEAPSKPELPKIEIKSQNTNIQQASHGLSDYLIFWYTTDDTPNM